MLRSLKDFIDTLLPPQGAGGASASAWASRSAGGGDAHRLQLATAVLLVEVMRADTTLGAAERASVLAALKRKFDLSAEELEGLVALAQTTAHSATDFHTFTSTLNDRLSHEEKVRVVEAMWDVAYADGELAAHEQHVLWRVSDLLHVPHGAYINAKIRAKAAAGL